MKTQLIKIVLLGLLTSVVMSPAWSKDVPSTTGFIEGKVTLYQDPDKAGAYRYEKPGLELKNYNRVAFEPMEIWIHPKSKYKGISPDDLKTIADNFVHTMVDELEPTYPVVSKAGPGTIVVRLAITNVKMKKKKRGLLGYTPIGFVVTAAAGPRVSLFDARIEAELLDALTGERLAVLVDKGLIASKEKDEKLSWDDIDERLRFYAKRFRARLDAAHQ